MCRLLGIYGQTDIWRDIAMAFSQQAEFGHIPPGENQEPGHKDGWGITIANHNKTAMIPVARQLGSAHEASCYREAVYATPGNPDVLLCHLRKASDIIPITLSNTHPFHHNGWALTHNGTIFKAESLPRDPSLTLTSDGSDTEHFFHYLLTKIMNRPQSQTIGRTMAMVVATINADYSALNVMLSNGWELYVIRRYKQWKTYYTMYYCTLPGSVIFCSQPIESPHVKPDSWKELPNDRLLRIYDTPFRMDEIKIGGK